MLNILIAGRLCSTGQLRHPLHKSVACCRYRGGGTSKYVLSERVALPIRTPKSSGPQIWGAMDLWMLGCHRTPVYLQLLQMLHPQEMTKMGRMWPKIQVSLGPMHSELARVGLDCLLPVVWWLEDNIATAPGAMRRWSWPEYCQSGSSGCC